MIINTGYFQLENGKKFIYSQDKFLFKFMLPNSITAEESIQISTSNQFLYGKDHENHNIAIFMGERAFKLYTYKNFKTSLYLVSNGNIYDNQIKEFKSLFFEGGVLHDLIDTNKYDFKDNDFSINIQKEKKIEINDFITFSYSYGLKADKTGVSTKPYIKLDFSKSISINYIHEYIDMIYKFCSILTFRKNISFDSIVVDKLSVENHYDCFVESKSYQTEHLIRTLNIEEIFDKIPIIIKMILENNEQKKHPLFSLNYFYESKHDSQYVSTNLIKDTCTALEIECVNQKELFEKEDLKIEEIKKDVKKLVDDKKELLNLEDSSYSNIINSMQYWSIGIKDKIKLLADKYKDILVEYGKCKRIEILDLYNNVNIDKISKFVNFRNKNTHPGIALLTNEIAEITIMMQVLAYTSLLSRLSIDKDLIKRKIVFLV